LTVQVTGGRKAAGRCVTNANGVPKWSSSGGANVATQTVGLYYPSQRDISRREHELAFKERVASEQKPVLTPISPGRGTVLLLCILMKTDKNKH